MKVYLAGPMRGLPEFNFPAFNAAAADLRSQGHEVFNPAERDVLAYGVDFSKGNATGSEEEATKTHGFNLREALGADMAYICQHAEAIALMPGWKNSKGAQAEYATAMALGLTIMILKEPPTRLISADAAFVAALQADYGDMKRQRDAQAKRVGRLEERLGAIATAIGA